MAAGSWRKIKRPAKKGCKNKWDRLLVLNCDQWMFTWLIQYGGLTFNMVAKC